MILHAVSWSFNIWHDLFKFRYKLYIIINLHAKSCNVDISLLAYLLISSELELKLSVIRKLIWAICRIFFPCLQRSLTTRQKCLFFASSWETTSASRENVFCRILTDILLKKFQYSSCQISLFEQLKLEVSIVNASAWYFDILQVKSDILIFSMLHLGIQIFCIQNQVLNFEYFDMQNIQLSIVLPVKSLSFIIACQISKLRYLACKSWDFRILKYPVWKNIGILRIGMLIFIFNIRYA